jgi:hypothetical protein
MSTTTEVVVGEFTFDTATDALVGPKAFLESGDYADWKARFSAGADPVFNAGLTYSPSPIMAMLVSIQTCYAGWHGRETFLRAHSL